MCNCLLNSLTLSERSAHVNRCLDRKCSSSKPSNSKKAVRRIENDDTDIASIFSPNSSSLIMASSSSSSTARNVRSRVISRNDVKKKAAVPVSKQKNKIKSERNDSDRDLTLASREVSHNAMDLTDSYDGNADGVQAIKAAPDNQCRAMIAPMKLRSSPMKPRAHAKMNMTSDESELYHLRFQLGEPSTSFLCYVTIFVFLSLMFVISVAYQFITRSSTTPTSIRNSRFKS